MKRRLCLLAFSLTLIGGAAVRGQTPDATDAKLLELVKALQVGTAQLAENQEKIDSKIAALAETIRLARVEASRTGRPPPPPPKPKK